MYPTIFAHDLEALGHIVRVTAFMSFKHKGIDGFQFHYDDREAIPTQPSFEGREVTFLMDGPGGERISGLEVLWSDQSRHVGIIV